MSRNASELEKLVDLLKSLTSGRFYGRLEIIFNAGRIVHIRKEESLKLN